MSNNESILGKEITLVEKANTSPFEVIEEIIGASEEAWLSKQLESWLVLALVSDSRYSLPPGRKIFRTFYENVKELLPQFSIVFDEMSKDAEWPKKNTTNLKRFKYTCAQFFNEFPITYIRRELQDWLFAALLYDGIGNLKFEPYLLFLVWQDLQGLLEAAWTICNQ